MDGQQAAIPEPLLDAMSDALYMIGQRTGETPADLSCQFCGARPKEPCVNADGSTYAAPDPNWYRWHESRARAYERLPRRRADWGREW